jgi:hypothetical protein
MSQVEDKQIKEARADAAQSKKRTLEDRVEALELLVALLRKEHREAQQEFKRERSDNATRCGNCHQPARRCNCTDV